jgi:hypothetical protein
MIADDLACAEAVGQFGNGDGRGKFHGAKVGGKALRNTKLDF